MRVFVERPIIPGATCHAVAYQALSQRAARYLAVGLALTAGLPVLAATQAIGLATVEAVQAPAWLERDGRRQPLAAGMEVRNGDQVRTGSEARAYLKLAEGSTVKLGENAALDLHSRSLKPARVFKGALDVLKGAFRFTTNALQRTQGQRELAIRIGTATAGIRGTDLWGKSDAERDLILLIEGRIEVRQSGTSLEMSEPLTYFSAPKNNLTSAPTLSRVDAEQFKQWARETEILPGDGAARHGGTWRLILARVGNQREALDIYDAARGAGYAVQIEVLPASNSGAGKDSRWEYEVAMVQLADEREAMVLAQKIKRQLSLDAIPGK